jgi:flagellar assembly protein FliH
MNAPPRPLALSALATRQVERPATRRYLFEEDFTSPQEAARARAKLAQAAPEPEVIVPSFTAEELAEARAEGMVEGRAAGMAEARAAAEARTAAALEAIATRLGEARREAAATAEGAAAALAVATLDLLALALPRAAAAHALPGCAELAETLLARLSGVERIAIRLPPELARTLAPRLEQAASAADFAGRLDVIPTDGMVAGEMRISWPGGEARRNPAALAAAAADVMRQLGLAPAGTDAAATAEQENGNVR